MRLSSLLVVITPLACAPFGGEARDSPPDAEPELVASDFGGCVTAEEPVYGPFTNEIPQEPICSDPGSRAFPSSARLVDMREIAPGNPGTCAPFAATKSKISLPTVEGGALAIRLPALSGGDPACAECIEPTSFGIAVELERIADHSILVRVPAPWFFVAGNEHEAASCMDGGPILEFGRPLACSSSWGTQFGFATADPNAPSVDALVEYIPSELVPEPRLCCPYTCAL